MSTLIINSGSSSIRYALFEKENEILKGHVDRVKDYEDGIKKILEEIESKAGNIEKPAGIFGVKFLKKIWGKKNKNQNFSEIKKIGHRVVHGAEKFKEPLKINFRTLRKLEKLSELAPLHNPANIACMKAARKIFPKAAQFAVFDTAFHTSLPEKAFLYGLPYRLYKKQGIRRYGFHGTSHEYVCKKAEKMLKKPSAKIISCHIGNGVSVCAVKNGKSLDTSMGFTPLEGPMMGTRSGTIDPAIIFHLAKKMPLAEVEKILEHESGFLGLSEISSDIRDLRAKPKSAGTLRVFETFSYQMAKIILGYFATLEGSPDAIIFTAGIGENAFYLREKICNYLKPFGLQLNVNFNKETCENGKFANEDSKIISAKTSKIKVFVIKTDEARQIYNSI